VHVLHFSRFSSYLLEASYDPNSIISFVVKHMNMGNFKNIWREEIRGELTNFKDIDKQKLKVIENN